MFDQLPPMKSLRAFEAAARLGSFKGAAEELFLTQGAISYQVQNLESYLQIKLFKRKVRQTLLTREGEQYYKTVHDLFVKLDAETRALKPAGKNKVITISVSTFFMTR